MSPLSQVVRLCPEKFWKFHLALMNGQEDFYDIPSSSRTPVETRAKLIELALPIVGPEKKGALTGLLAHKTTPNGGNAVTDDLKYTSTFGSKFVAESSLTLSLNSQILPSELNPCLPNRPLGWARCTRNFQRLGRKGVDELLGVQGSHLDQPIKLNACMYHSSTDRYRFEFHSR